MRGRKYHGDLRVYYRNENAAARSRTPYVRQENTQTTIRFDLSNECSSLTNILSASEFVLYKRKHYLLPVRTQL